MRYDSKCFERCALNAELEYLALDFSARDEVHRCSGFCGNEATEFVAGNWYCAECAEEAAELTDCAVFTGG